jgi:putative ABC transport system permease protein
MATSFQELRIALRTLLRSPGFTLLAILTLALGIGATTALFSIAYGVLLRPLPYPDADRIVQVFQIGADGRQSANISEPNYIDLRDGTRSFAALAQVGLVSTVTVLGGSEAARATYLPVSREFFDVIGVQPLLGRTFLPEEQREGAPPAAIVSHEFWQRYLGANSDLSARPLTAEGRTYTVIGVLPPGLGTPASADVFTPRELYPRQESRTAHNWWVYGRLADGVTVEAARREMSLVSGQIRERYGDDTWMADATAVALPERVVGAVRPVLLVLLGASAILLLIAAANVTSLLLARTVARRREMAVRAALGAGRGRLVRQCLTESALLALAGGLLGTLIAIGGVEALRVLAPPQLPRLADVRIDGFAIVFAVSASVLVALGLGLATGLRAGTGSLPTSLGERQGSGGRESQRARGLLVSAQVAMTLVLLVGTGLLGRSMLGILALDPGYRTGGAMVVSLAPSRSGGDDDTARQIQLQDELMERLAALPGAGSVGGVNDLPLAGGFYPTGTFLLMNRPDEVTGMEDFVALARLPGRTGQGAFRVASGGYFSAMDIPLIQGRLFDERDHIDAPHVAVVSQSLARSAWPDEDPIGKIVQFGNMDGDIRPFTVVGVVGDIRESGLVAEPQPTFYAHHRQRPAAAGRFHVVVGTRGRPEALFPAARAALVELAPDVPPLVRSLEGIHADWLAQRRFSFLLFGAFGATALLLAMMGLYGVVAYTVTHRTREIGIRAALGAGRGDVLRLVLRQALPLIFLGLGAGILAALALSRFVAGMLYGTSPTDPLTYAVIAAVLAATAGLASYIPARRAAGVDPMVAMRTE